MFTLDQTALLDRIMSFPIDGDAPVAYSFVARLADENGWSRSFAERVVREYKRFVYLAMTAGHPVTPSDEVDQAWHLHLTYTRSYWERFCSDVLPRPLHHEPTRGGAAEGAKFHDWYARTLDSYFRIFKENAPADIWPPAIQRFDQTNHFQRINAADFIFLPLRSLKRLAAGFALSLVAFGASGASGELLIGAAIQVVLVFAALVLVAALIWRCVEWWRSSARQPCRRRSECSGDSYGGGCGGGGTAGAATTAGVSHTTSQSAADHGTSMPAEAGDVGAGGDAGCGAASGCGSSGCSGGGGCGGGGCGGGD